MRPKIREPKVLWAHRRGTGTRLLGEARRLWAHPRSSGLWPMGSSGRQGEALIADLHCLQGPDSLLRRKGIKKVGYEHR